MNYQNIRAFIEVTSCGSFQRAADNLHITQSAMSARIKSLEVLLNRQLFIRNRNGAKLTSGGYIFAQHAMSMMRTWERARNELMLPEIHTQVIRLGVQTNHWSNVGQPWLKWMKESSPEIATQIRIDYSIVLINLLKEGIIDLAIVYESENRSGIIFEDFSAHDLVLVSTTPRNVERGLVDGYIYVDWGNSFRNLHNQYYPDAPYHQLEFGEAETAFKYMMENGGSGYFLKDSIKNHLENEILHLVRNAPTIPIKTYLMCADDRRNHTEVQQAIIGLKEVSVH
jgi:DNA-binding transcriptional LysR family regulator